ncbi:MAG: DUF4185 domain-containing protein [Pseudonocardia sp.]
MVDPPLVVPDRVEVVSSVTGEGSPNRTGSRFGFLATDLGILWDDGSGNVLAAFGDTYGQGWSGPGAGRRSADHRRNVLLRTSAEAGPGDPADGLRLDQAVQDSPGHAAEILPKDHRPLIESTVIPTSGIAVDGVQYLHYMSVARWRRRGWRTNYGGIATSADGGLTWEKPRRARWRNSVLARRSFQLGAFARDRHWVYLFGTPNGRFGDIHLARVDPRSVADPGRYQYWTGSEWTSRPRTAAPVAAGPAGELSVGFHTGLGCWLMVHLDDPAGRIVLRAADAVTGPWSDGQTLVSGTEHPALYGGYLHPRALHGDSICFTMSQWGPYNVYLVRAELSRR